uniref:Uncharacterized protein n=1 Tax=Neovison vison TaxID=452646 RepID=A0A8C7EVL2_NEOVI
LSTKKGQTVALKLSSLARDPPAQCSVDLVRNDKFYWQVTIMRSNSASTSWLDMSPKAREKKVKMNYWDFVKIKSFCTAKKIVSKKQKTTN